MEIAQPGRTAQDRRYAILILPHDVSRLPYGAGRPGLAMADGKGRADLGDGGSDG
jgi:hypothetical protein